MLGRLRRLFISGEERLFGEIRELIELSIEAIDILARGLELEDSGDVDGLEEVSREIGVLEKRGDEKLMEISAYVMSGAVFPGFRSQILTLINHIDDVLDSIHVLSREMARVNKYCRDMIAEFPVANDGILRQLSHAKRMLSRLRDLFEVSGASWQSVVALAAEIERME
jgi:predicted phosphate transport protein (TIGR00153 family)